MRGYFTRLVIFNSLICAIFGAIFAIPIGRLEIGLVAGLVFGIATALIVEIVFRRWKGRWLYRRRMLFLVLLEVLLTLYLLMPAYIAYFSMRPTRTPVAEMPAEIADSAEEVSLQTSDGISLAGWYLPSQNGAAIIALHGGGGNRLGVVPHALMLNEAGYGVLMMDMRAHGASGGDVFVDGWHSAIDGRSMVEYLQSRPDVECIGGLGLSSGAVSILHAGADIQAIEALVAEGTGAPTAEDLLNPLTPDPLVAPLLVPGYWTSNRFMALFSGVTPLPPMREQVTRIAPRPMLFIAGADSMWEDSLATKYAASAGDSAQVWVIPNTGHIAGIQVVRDEYAARVIGFFDAALQVVSD